MDFIKHVLPKDNTSDKAPLVMVCDVLKKKENRDLNVELRNHPNLVKMNLLDLIVNHCRRH